MIFLSFVAAISWDIFKNTIGFFFLISRFYYCTLKIYKCKNFSKENINTIGIMKQMLSLVIKND